MGLMSWLRDGSSWLRGGARTEGDARAEEGGARTGSDARADRDHGVWAERGAPRERADLSELPPIQRTLAGGQGLVTNPSGFQETLSTRRDIALGTPLGHLVSPDAPTGLVHGVTAPAPVERGGDPVQRSAQAPGEASGSAPGEVWGGASAGFPVRGRPLPVSPSASVGVPAPGPADVQRAMDGRSAAMTSAGDSAAAELPVRHLVGERAVATVADGPGAVPGAPPAFAPDAEPVPPSVQRAAVPPAGDRARRAPGLGAPLSALPPTAQRRAAATDATGATGAGPATGTAAEVAPIGPVVPVVARSAESGDRSGATAGVPAPPDTAMSRETSDSEAPTAPLLGEDPLLVVPSEPVPSEPVPVSGAVVQRRTAQPPPAPLSPPPATGPVAPLLADRPLTPQSVDGGSVGGGTAAAVQRVGPADGPGGTGHGSTSASVSGAASGALPGTGPVPDAVPVRWTSAGTRPPGALSTAATASLSAAVPLQRGGAPQGNAPGGYPPPRPGVQRQAFDGPPVPRSAGATGSRTASASSMPADGFTTAGSVAVTAGVAQRMADGSVVFGPPPPTYSAPVVQRETESAEPPPPEPPPNPGPEPDPEPQPEPEPGPEPTGAAAGAPAPPGAHLPAPGGAPPVVTDELVRALYPPLSRLLKADLRLERERSGFLINTRH
ncbi:hypothetical protein [Streptomyces sp. NPDC047985]|uniref:hypothetical protein n=1 Tax=Streptomyces sp. NPDC047985 TaxID=3155384 RepID=UPI003424DB20